MDPHTLISVGNPIILALILLVVMIMVILIYNRFIIIPLKQKHLEEEEKIKLQQAELMALFASLSPDPIFRFDEAGKISLANNSAHLVFPSKELLNEQVQNVLPFTKQYDLKEIINLNKTLLDTAQFEKNFYQFLIVGSSKFKMGHAYGRDITELKLTEQDLKEALVKAEDAKRTKEYFLAQISHEIRSPLNVIVGYSDLLSEELKDLERFDLVSILKSIKNNSKRLYRTFDLLLNMSQLHTGSYNARFEKINLLNLLTMVHAEYLSLAEEKNLELILTNTLNNHIMLYCDHYSMVQVFVNLIDNAIKYTAKGKIETTIYNKDSSLCVDISDSGKGMSKDFVERLFIPFTQEEMGYTRRFDGTGLGLAIANNFIKLNNAKIVVNSKPDLGTTVSVIFNGDKFWNNNLTKGQDS